MAGLPTADQFFGPAKAPQGPAASKRVPTADEFFGPAQPAGGQSVDQLVAQNTPAGLKPGGHVDYRDDGSGETLPSSLQDVDPRTARVTANPRPPAAHPADELNNPNPVSAFWADYTKRVHGDQARLGASLSNDAARGKFVNDAWRRGGPAAARAAEHQWDAAHRGQPGGLDAVGPALDLTPFGAPIEAAGDTVVGRPLEATTGINRQVAGDVAGMAVPAYEGAKLAGAGEEALRAALTRGRFRPAETPLPPGRVAPADQLLRDARGRPAPQAPQQPAAPLPAIDPKGASFEELKAARQGARRAERQGGTRPLQQVELAAARRGTAQAAEDAQGRAARLTPEQLAQARAGATRVAEDAQGAGARLSQRQLGEAGQNLARKSVAEQARAEAGQTPAKDRAAAVSRLKAEGVSTGRGAKAERSLRNAVYDRVLKQVGDRAPRGLGDRETFEAVNKKLSDRYDRLVPSLKMVEDETFKEQVNQVVERESAMLGEKEGVVQRIYNHAVNKRVGPNGELYGQAFKDAESEITGIQQELYKGGYGTAGDALERVKMAMRESLERHSAPAVRGQLRKLNGAYRDFAVARRAAAAVPTELGAWGPDTLLNAINAMDYSAGKGTFGKGQAKLQDLAEDAYRVMGPKQKNRVAEAGKNVVAAGAYGTTGHPIAATHSLGRAIRELTQ